MARARWFGSVVLVLCVLGGVVHATSVGLAVGIDPTGVILASALTELELAGNFDLRAEVGVATGDLAGLMLVTGTVLGHYTLDLVDPFAGVGVGVAMTPPPFSTALVVEGVAGVRVLAFDSVALLAQVRYVVRWLAEGLTAGPIYEAGLEVRF